jgi:hypothetical protein
MKLPSVLSRLDLPEPELQAARLDGELFAIDECFSPVDEVEQRGHRAAALAALLPSKLIAEQHTAAWVYGILDAPPSRHEFCADIGARIRPSSLARLTLREVVIDAEDIVEIGELRLTSPLRTVVDLARFSEEFDPEIVRDLMLLGDLGLDDCRDMLDRRRNLPGKRRALDRIESALPIRP